MMAATRWPLRGVMGLAALLAVQGAFAPAAHARHHRHRHEAHEESARTGGEGKEKAQPITSPVPESCDNSKFLADLRAAESAQAPHPDRVEHVCGHVLTVAPAKRTRSGLHGYFYVDVGQGVSIRIVSDLDRMTAPTWPWVAKGDQTDVLGRYYYDNPQSQGIDWTHHGTGKSWPVEGYVVVNGTRYQ
ncbi:DUF3465 domain-containing protein [Komagataeibacter medellinensis]|uniref:DUF3465 domain-containing protein n=1 Tax=Komagataeibacter medellinensis TaxID=1177712 RepID=A0ABQ6VWP8_9PROT|nr:DUF3465 domain-containing protein [Komagataeibacter medellinensis]KAB8124605.1 DUF3465 domain-containing protein [Komagataeibacter medellinensis]